MTKRGGRPTGLTKDVGWQVGVRRTLPISQREAWDLVTSDQGLRLWLGQAAGIKLEEGARYELEDQSKGEMRVISPGSHLRLTWRPRGWPRPSTIQVRVIPKGEKSTIAFHQEHLPGPYEREAQRDHFKLALDGLEELIRAS